MATSRPNDSQLKGKREGKGEVLVNPAIVESAVKLLRKKKEATQHKGLRLVREISKRSPEALAPHLPAISASIERIVQRHLAISPCPSTAASASSSAVAKNERDKKREGEGERDENREGEGEFTQVQVDLISLPNAVHILLFLGTCWGKPLLRNNYDGASVELWQKRLLWFLRDKCEGSESKQSASSRGSHGDIGVSGSKRAEKRKDSEFSASYRLLKQLQYLSLWCVGMLCKTEEDRGIDNSLPRSIPATEEDFGNKDKNAYTFVLCLDLVEVLSKYLLRSRMWLPCPEEEGEENERGGDEQEEGKKKSKGAGAGRTAAATGGGEESSVSGMETGATREVFSAFGRCFVHSERMWESAYLSLWVPPMCR